MKQDSRKILIPFFALALVACIGTCEMLADMTSREASSDQEDETGYSLYPPEGFNESDLIGTWDSWREPGLEVITLREDQTYRQTYHSKSSNYLFETEGEWSIEYRSSGCVYIHLNNARYYYASLEVAENGNKYPSDNKPVEFWDVCEDKWIEMPDKVILLVGSAPDFPGNLRLLHMRSGQNVYDQMLKLVDN